jgi:hypothetical protein
MMNHYCTRYVHDHQAGRDLSTSHSHGLCARSRSRSRGVLGAECCAGYVCGCCGCIKATREMYRIKNQPYQYEVLGLNAKIQYLSQAAVPGSSLRSINPQTPWVDTHTVGLPHP